MSVLKFHSNTLLSFEHIEIFIFSSTWLGLSDHAPFFKGFLGEFDPLNVVGRRANPKTAHPCVIPRNLSHYASKSADGSVQ